MFEYLLSLIPRGKEKAVSNAALQSLLHQTRREVSQTIHDARMNGHIICSGIRGYYIPDSDAELIEGYNTLWSMSVGGLASQKAMRDEIVRRGLLDQTKEAKSRANRNARKLSDEQKTEDNGLSNSQDKSEGV